jgi:hypothetical protein
MTNGQARMLGGVVLVLAGVILGGLTYGAEKGPGGFGGLICLAGLVFSASTTSAPGDEKSHRRSVRPRLTRLLLLIRSPHRQGWQFNPGHSHLFIYQMNGTSLYFTFRQYSSYPARLPRSDRSSWLILNTSTAGTSTAGMSAQYEPSASGDSPNIKVTATYIGWRTRAYTPVLITTWLSSTATAREA